MAYTKEQLKWATEHPIAKLTHVQLARMTQAELDEILRRHPISAVPTPAVN